MQQPKSVQEIDFEAMLAVSRELRAGPVRITFRNGRMVEGLAISCDLGYAHEWTAGPSKLEYHAHARLVTTQGEEENIELEAVASVEQAPDLFQKMAATLRVKGFIAETALLNAQAAEHLRRKLP